MDRFLIYFGITLTSVLATGRGIRSDEYRVKQVGELKQKAASSVPALEEAGLEEGAG